MRRTRSSFMMLGLGLLLANPLACKSETVAPKETTRPHGADATPQATTETTTSVGDGAVTTVPVAKDATCAVVQDDVFAYVALETGPFIADWPTAMTACAETCGTTWTAPTVEQALVGAAVLRAKGLTQFWTATEDTADVAKAIVYEDGASEADLRAFGASKESFETAVCHKAPAT